MASTAGTEPTRGIRGSPAVNRTIRGTLRMPGNGQKFLGEAGAMRAQALVLKGRRLGKLEGTVWAIGAPADYAFVPVSGGSRGDLRLQPATNTEHDGCLLPMRLTVSRISENMNHFERRSVKCRENAQRRRLAAARRNPARLLADRRMRTSVLRGSYAAQQSSASDK